MMKLVGTAFELLINYLTNYAVQLHINRKKQA